MVREGLKEEQTVSETLCVKENARVRERERERMK